MGRRIKQVGTTLAEVADNIEEQARQDAAKRDAVVRTQRERAEKLIDVIGEVLRVMRPDFELLASLVEESQVTQRHGGTGDDSIDLARWTNLRALKVSLGHAYANLHHAQTSFKR